MTIKTFYESYHTTIEEILERFSEVEGKRIARVIEGGNHYTINQEKENIEMLCKARMIKGISITSDDDED